MAASLWVAAGSLLALAGVTLFIWAVWWDRSRGRRRCPRCWYDLGGVSGVVCPECGRTARSERRLTRTRRRWKWAAAAAAIAFGGFAATRVPVVRQRGWTAALPATALRVVMAPFGPQAEAAFARNAGRTPQSAFERLLVAWHANKLLRRRLGVPFHEAIFGI